MLSFFKLNRILTGLLIAALLLVPFPAFAVDIQGSLVVQVMSAKDESPRPGATVKVQDQAQARGPVTKTTDSTGQARFDALLIGSYSVEVSQAGYETDRAVVTVTRDATATYQSFLDVTGGEKVIKVRENVLLVNPEDAKQPATTRDTTFIETKMANSDNLQKVLDTSPGVNENSLGQVHFRGEHKSVSLSVDGVNVPEPTENVATQIMDPRFLDQIQVIGGGYDASYGGQLGVVFNMVTKTGPQKPYVEFVPRFGDNGIAEELIRAGGSDEKGTTNWFVGAVNSQTNLFLEAPNPNVQNLTNNNSAQNYVVKLNRRDDKNEYGLTLTSVNGNYGLPLNPQDFNAGVRQSEADVNQLAVLSVRHHLNTRDDLLLGMSVLKATQNYSNNSIFTPFVPNANPDLQNDALAELGFLLPANPENPGIPYLPQTNLEIDQFQPSIEWSRHLGDNDEMKFGVTFDAIFSNQNVNISMPGAVGAFGPDTGQALLNDVIAGGLLPPGNNTILVNGVPAFVTQLGRHGSVESTYFSRTQQLSKRVVLNWGLRADRYQDGISVDQSQISPLINASFIVTPTSALRVSYNRLFQPPPLELDTSGNSSAFPQRTNAYEVSYEWQPSKQSVANVTAVYKDYTNPVDVALLIPGSNFPVFAPVNFGHGFYKGIDGGITTRRATGFNYFLSATFSEAKPTQPGPFDTIVPQFNDHDQRLQFTGGLSQTNDNGLTSALDLMYGSGLPLDSVAIYNKFGTIPFGLIGNRIPRFVANLNFTFHPLGSDGKPRQDLGYGFSVLNLNDSRAPINFLSAASGTRFVLGRRIVANGNIRW